MSLFGPTIIGGSGGGQSSGSAPAQGGGSGLTALALRVSPDGSTLEFQRADGTWATTGLTPTALLAALPMVQLTDSDGVVHATLPGTI